LLKDINGRPLFLRGLQLSMGLSFTLVRIPPLKPSRLRVLTLMSRCPGISISLSIQRPRLDPRAYNSTCARWKYATFCEFLAFQKTFQKTFLTGSQKYLAKRKLDSASFIKRHSFIANATVQVKRMKSELQLVDSVAQFLVQTVMSKVHKKSRCFCDHWEVRSGGCREASKQRMYVSKLTMPEIRALCLFYLKTEIAKQRK
jgi:hypothetical protein